MVHVLFIFICGISIYSWFSIDLSKKGYPPVPSWQGSWSICHALVAGNIPNNSTFFIPHIRRLYIYIINIYIPHIPQLFHIYIYIYTQYILIMYIYIHTCIYRMMIDIPQNKYITDILLDIPHRISSSYITIDPSLPRRWKAITLGPDGPRYTIRPSVLRSAGFTCSDIQTRKLVVVVIQQLLRGNYGWRCGVATNFWNKIIQ